MLKGKPWRTSKIVKSLRCGYLSLLICLLLIWPAAAGPKAPEGQYAHALALSGDHSLILSTDQGIYQLDLASGAVLRHWPGLTPNAIDAWPDGRTLRFSNLNCLYEIDLLSTQPDPRPLMCSEDTLVPVAGINQVFRIAKQPLQLWLQDLDKDQKTRLPIRRREYAPDSFGRLPDGRLLVSDDSGIRIFGPLGQAQGLFSFPDWSPATAYGLLAGDLLSSHEDGRLVRWDLARGRIRTLLREPEPDDKGYSRRIHGFFVKPSGWGAALLSGSRVLSWGFDPPQQFGEESEHEAGLLTVSADGQRYAFRDGDGWVALRSGRHIDPIRFFLDREGQTLRVVERHFIASPELGAWGQDKGWSAEAPSWKAADFAAEPAGKAGPPGWPSGQELLKLAAEVTTTGEPRRSEVRLRQAQALARVDRERAADTIEKVQLTWLSPAARAQALLLRAVLLTERDPRLDELGGLLDQLEALLPQAPDLGAQAWLLRARWQIEHGQDAGPAFTRALALKPCYGEALAARGSWRIGLDPAAARLDFERSLACGWDGPEVLLGLARMEEHPTAAEAAWERVLAALPLQQEAYDRLAELAETRGDSLAAARVRERQGLRTQAKQAFLEQARLLLATGFPGQASEALMFKEFERLPAELFSQLDGQRLKLPAREGLQPLRLLPLAPYPARPRWLTFRDGRVTTYDGQLFDPSRQRWLPPMGDPELSPDPVAVNPHGDRCQARGHDDQDYNGPDGPTFNYYRSDVVCSDAAGKVWYAGGPVDGRDARQRLLGLGARRELLMYDESERKALHSRDAGRHWQVLELPEPAGQAQRQADGSWLLATAKGLYRGEPDLTRWRPLALAGVALGPLNRRPDGNWWIQAGATIRLARDPHAWRTLALPLGEIEVKPLAPGLWVQHNDERLYLSRDLEAWTPWQIPARLSQLAQAAGQFWLLDTDHGLWRSSGPAAPWQRLAPPIAPDSLLGQPDALWINTPAGAFRSRGLGWDFQAQGLPPEEPERILATGSDLFVANREYWYRWQAGGWQPLPGGESRYTRLYPAGEALLMSSGNYFDPVTWSGDGGRSWQQLPWLPGWDQAVYPLHVRSGLALAGSSHGLYRSHDKARSWVPTGLPDQTVLFVQGPPWLAGGTRGLYSSANGTDWRLEACAGHWAQAAAHDGQGRLAAVCDGELWLRSDTGWRTTGLAAQPLLSLQGLAEGFLLLTGNGTWHLSDLNGAGPGPSTPPPLAAPLSAWLRADKGWVLGDRNCQIHVSNDQGRSWVSSDLPEAEQNTCKAYAGGYETGILALRQGQGLELLTRGGWYAVEEH